MLGLSFIGTLLLYAGNAVVHYAADTTEELECYMQRDLTILNEWLCRNVLTMNVGKTCDMTFGRSRNHADLNLKINNVNIYRVRTFKYLGLALDEKLSFGAHVDHVKKTIRPFMPLMWRNGTFIPANKVKTLYYAYVQSHIAYMLPIYSEGNVCRMTELQTVQNGCVKALLTPTTYLHGTGSTSSIEQLSIVERLSHL